MSLLPRIWTCYRLSGPATASVAHVKNMLPTPPLLLPTPPLSPPATALACRCLPSA